MRCVSSVIQLNLVSSVLAWFFLSLIQRTYHAPVQPPIPVKFRIITAILQIVHYLIFSKSIVINTYATHRFALLLSIPYTIIVSHLKGSRKFNKDSIIALTVFCIGSCFVSTDAFNLSFHSVCISLLYTIVNAHLSLFIETAMSISGSDSLFFQESVASFKVIFSGLLSAMMAASNPSEQLNIQLNPFSICLIVGVSALDLAMRSSMISMISNSSAVAFVVVEQFCELMMILIGHTLNPTRFTTFREAIMSFIGFGLALPALIMFIFIKSPESGKPMDVEPFQVVQGDSKQSSCEEDEM